MRNFDRILNTFFKRLEGLLELCQKKNVLTVLKNKIKTAKNKCVD